MAFLLWIVLRHIYTNSHYATPYDDEVEDEWEMVGGSRLPHEPSAVALIDAKGKMRWTVSIPSTYDFPLQPAQYREICHQAMELSKEVSQGPKKSASHARRMVPYNQKDQYYIDIKEAEEQALLPPAKSKGRPKNFVEDQAMKDGASTEGLKVCERSLTYVMETGDAGFGNTLMRLWMSYGLAKTENRAFFIDDSRWYAQCTCKNISSTNSELGPTANTRHTSNLHPLQAAFLPRRHTSSLAPTPRTTLSSAMQP